MRKTCVLLFSLMTISVSLYAALRPSYLLRLLLDLSDPLFMAGRLGIALLLLLYLFWPEVRTISMKILMIMIGVVLTAVGSSAFVSPTLFGYFQEYIPIGDVFIVLEGGVLALLLAAELPVRKPSFDIPQIRTQHLPNMATLMSGRHHSTT